MPRPRNPRYQPPQKSAPSEVNLLVKYILFSLNVLFWLFGLVMVVVGVYARSEKTFGELSSKIPWFMDPANLFIVVGVIIFTLAFFGCVGSLRENMILLKVFEYTLAIILVLEVAVAIYVYVDSTRVKDNVAEVLQETIPRYRDDVDLQSIIDWTQATMQCCGIKSDADWNENVYFNCTVRKFPNPERCGVPFSCCKNYDTEKNRQCGYMMRDPKNDAVKGNKIFTDGCVDAVIKHLLNEDQLILLVCVAGAVVLLQLMTVGLAHTLVEGIRRQKSKYGGGGENNPNFERMAETSS